MKIYISKKYYAFTTLNAFMMKTFHFLDFKILLSNSQKLILAKIHILLHFQKLVFTKSGKYLFPKIRLCKN